MGARPDAVVLRKRPVDAVIVGFGWAGSIMAAELCEAGLSVVALERGGPRRTVPDFAYPRVADEIAVSARHRFLQDLGTTTVSVRHDATQTAVPYRQYGAFKMGEGVGGGGIHWGGVHARVMPEELAPASHYRARYGAGFVPDGMTLQDWGIDTYELEPYFDKFERVCGTSGQAGNLRGRKVAGGNPFERPRSRDFPTPPMDDHLCGTLFAKATAELGYHPYPVPSDNLSRAYRNIYGCQMGPCNFCGFCNDYGCLNYSKSSPQVCTIPYVEQFANFELRTHAHVRRVNLAADGRTATGVTYGQADGREVEQAAAIVILAAYQLHNVRLMLSSGIGRPYDPTTGTGVIGRNYCYQIVNSVDLFFDKGVFTNPFMGTGAGGRAIDDFYGDNFDHGPLGFIGGGLLSGRQGGGGPVRGVPLPDGTPRWGAEWKRAVVDHFAHTARIEAQLTVMPYRQCYLDLDPTYRDAYGDPLLRMTFDWQANEGRMSVWVQRKLAEIGRAMGAPRQRSSALDPDKPWDTRPYNSSHTVGGTPMGADPNTSAVNPRMQSWDVHNLFVTGANLFANSIGYNPTGLVGALAYRCADAIRRDYLAAPGPLAR